MANVSLARSVSLTQPAITSGPLLEASPLPRAVPCHGVPRAPVTTNLASAQAHPPFSWMHGNAFPLLHPSAGSEVISPSVMSTRHIPEKSLKGGTPNLTACLS